MDWNEYFFRHVYLAAATSRDPRTKIGAVLVKGKHIISTGFNGFPAGIKDLEERYNNRELKHQLVCHAESNTITDCASRGVSSCDSTCYTQGIPCSFCCKTLIQGGITKVIVHRQWPNLIHDPNWVKSIELSNMMFKEAGITIEWYDKVLGIEGFLDGKIIKV